MTASTLPPRRSADIAVAHSPGANASSVADIAVILMLAVTRRLLPADDYVRSGGWSSAKPSPMMRPQAGMRGRRIGVYGMGEIGRKIAGRVAAFETEVGYFSRSRHDVPYQYLPSLEALADWCSVLMIAVRAGADTHHAVDAAILKKLGADGYVVNISRGSVIDQPALVAALADNTIAGAGLDVFEQEPHAPDALTAFAECGADPAYRRPHPGIAHGDAGLRDRQSRGVLCRQAAALSGPRGLNRRFSANVVQNRWPTIPARILLLASRKKLVKQSFPDVLAVAGTSVLAFRKPDTLGDHSFQDIRMDCSKGRKTVVWEGCRQGSFGSPDGLDPVQDCRRPRRNQKFLQRLNLIGLHRRVKTGFRFTSRFTRRTADMVRTSTPRARSAREGRLFKCRRARRVLRL